MRMLIGIVVAVVLGLGNSRATEPLPEPDWARLVAVGKKHGLPLPDDDTARLALIHSESYRMIGDFPQWYEARIYVPGWLLEEKADGGIRALVGVSEKHLEPRKAREPLWREFSMVEPEMEIGGHVVELGYEEAFVTAVQCAALEKQDVASRLWQRMAGKGWLAQGVGELREVADAERPELILALMLIEHLEHRILEPNADFRKIETALKSLLDDFPVLAVENRKTYLRRLALTNAAAPAKPGSVEALLIEFGRSMGFRWYDFLDDAWDEPGGRIIRMGFEAVPELLRLQADERLTSQRKSYLSTAPRQPMLLGELAQALLAELLPQAWLQPVDLAQSERFSREWERIRTSDEREYYAEVALRFIQGEKKQAEAAVLAVVAEKAPERLAGLMASFIKEAGDNDSPWNLAQAVRRADLPDEAKRSLLLKLATGGSLLRQRQALQILAHFDPAAAIGPARDLVKNLPQDSRGPFRTSAISSVSHVVLTVDDDEIWQTFFDKSHKAAVEQRLEWMNPFSDTYIGNRLKSRRLAFLAGFLEDTALRDESVEASEFTAPCEASSFPKITVRDFAAMQIASILEIERHDRPDATWSADRWRRLREKVTVRLADEGIEAMTPTDH